ncbi:MAG TPA: patatin-like phospholipase family protein [Bradyrhizobium sp.]|nr:patatin-like phospholipase family protein [Bradyrhizobium sp.]
MNQNDSSGAQRGLNLTSTPSTTGALRSGASALLAAADIWSTNDAASPPEQAVASAPAPESATTTESAGVSDNKDASENNTAGAENDGVSETGNLVDTGKASETSTSSEGDKPSDVNKIRAKASTWRTPQPSELLAEARFFFNSIGKRARQDARPTVSPETSLTDTKSIETKLASLASAAKASANQTSAREVAALTAQSWPPQTLSLALQGGGCFAAFTWGVLERLLEEPTVAFDAISGASAGSVNAVLLASGLAEGGRERAHARLAQFWNRMVNEASFRSLMLLGGFSPAGSSVAFGTALRSGQFDPLDLDPLRRVLAKHVNFDALRTPAAPRLLIAATRVRDGAAHLFRNAEITADVVLASTCPPLVHCAVDIDGDAHWDGGYSANPPLVALLQESVAPDVLVVQATPSRDSYVPITGAAIDRRLDQITANTALNAELAALQWACAAGAIAPRIARIAAEDEIEGLAQRSAVDLGRAFVMALHRSGRTAADRWLRGGSKPAPAPQESVPVQPSLVPA